MYFFGKSAESSIVFVDSAIISRDSSLLCINDVVIKECTSGNAIFTLVNSSVRLGDCEMQLNECDTLFDVQDGQLTLNRCIIKQNDTKSIIQAVGASNVNIMQSVIAHNGDFGDIGNSISITDTSIKCLSIRFDGRMYITNSMISAKNIVVGAAFIEILSSLLNGSLRIVKSGITASQDVVARITYSVLYGEFMEEISRIQYLDMITVMVLEHSYFDGNGDRMLSIGSLNAIGRICSCIFTTNIELSNDILNCHVFVPKGDDFIEIYDGDVHASREDMHRIRNEINRVIENQLPMFLGPLMFRLARKTFGYKMSSHSFLSMRRGDKPWR